MSVVLSISNRNIRIVEGSGKLKNLKNMKVHAIPEGLMEQGAIEQEEKWIEFLEKIWSENQFSKSDVKLLLATRKISIKLIEAPELKEKELDSFIGREFKEYESNKEQIYSYQKISPKTEDKMQQILAAKIEQEELEKYQRIFRQAGIKLSSVEILQSDLINRVSKENEVQNKTCIVQVAQGASVTNLLFLNGYYNYSNTTQIFEEHGTIAYAIEVARSVSEILQFMQANQISHHDMTVYLEDFKLENQSNCMESIEQMNAELLVEVLESPVEVFGKGNPDAAEYLPACYGLLDYPKNMNLLQALLKCQKKEKKNPELIRFARPFLILAGCLAAVTAVLGGMNIASYMQLKQLQNYNQNQQILENAAQYDATYDKAVAMQTDVDDIGRIQTKIDSYPTASIEVENSIDSLASGYADVVVESFDAATGIITLNATAKEVDKINSFIDKLNQADFIYKVDYTGYNQDDGSDFWQVNLTCYLAESAGKETK